MKINLNGLDKKLQELAELRGIQKVVKDNTAEMQNKAMRAAPVDTGNLKRSIAIEMKSGGLVGVVRGETDYAGYVETGTRHMSAQPYLRPALFDQTFQFLSDMDKLIDKR